MEAYTYCRLFNLNDVLLLNSNLEARGRPIECLF